ncbi:hypothetical protein O6H91_04G127700 [Diphasiastrum complanatum]|uniref:Uncharacterized protein n=1 Tax=Diphasiastrum complanatum TaxID=34168 RepID=A0ACC2E1B8_DIPCM|nr:hypothetical protein O6H91_04G127700 [Diphasiastrum complanatum]
MSTTDHPQTDGQTERVNQVLEDILRAYVSKKQTNWEEYLSILEFSYNRRDVQFSAGEKVYLRVPVDSKTLKSGVCAKLSPRYCGPFTISRRLGEVTYELELPHSSKVFPVFHVS